MKRTLPILLLLCLLATASAQQQYPVDYFSHPLDLKVSMTGDFAEIRPNHYHSGLDLRTEGTTGHKVYAPADGYVSRINISAWGGGKVLYITHPNGYRTVYMHLDGFCGDIARFVETYQYSHRTFAFDVDIPPDSLPVKRGQVVALTGNTGGSGGPHLHYEIRHAENDQPINPLYFGIKYSDPIAPTIAGIKLYPADERTAINGANSELEILAAKPKSKKSKGKGTQPTGIVTVAGRFYTGIYTYDRMEQGSNNKNGVEKIELYVDGELFHRYHVPTFLFEDTRAINAIIDYPQYQRNRQYYIVTRRLRGDPGHASSPFRDNGYIEFTDSASHTLEYRVSDYKGNTTSHKFSVQSQPDKLLPGRDSAQRSIEASGEPIVYYLSHTLTREGFQAVLPPHTVYDNDKLIYSKGSDAANLSPLHRLSLKRHQLPPHNTVTVRMPVPAKVPSALHNKLTIVCINGKSISACTTKRDGSTLTATTRSFGGFAVRLDTVPPTVKAVNFSDNRTFTGKQLTVKIADDLSGVERYECFINGAWVLAEHDGKTATLTAKAATLTKGNNEVVFRITDAVGNVTEQKWTVIKP